MPLTALEAELPRFGEPGRNYALRLLFQNETGIETRQPDALVQALLSLHFTTDKEREFLLSLRERLEAALTVHNEERSSRAAALLLDPMMLETQNADRCEMTTLRPFESTAQVHRRVAQAFMRGHAIMEDLTDDAERAICRVWGPLLNGPQVQRGLLSLRS